MPLLKKPARKKTGARGLRGIFEAAMLNIMYDLPSQKDVREVVFNESAILRREPPLVVMGEKKSPKLNINNFPQQ